MIFFLNEDDKHIFEEYLKNPNMILMEMSNVLGNEVKVEPKLPFSFYFSTKKAVHDRHGIRAKILWNPSKAPAYADGYIDLHGNYEYIIGFHKYKPTSKELIIAKNFFKKYKVLFAAVWEEIVDQSYVERYFNGDYNIKQLLSKFNIEDEQKYFKLNHCNNIEEVEQIVRKYNMFNMND